MHPDNLKVFVAVPRTGSTLFMRIMAECPDIAVTSRNVLMGNMKPRQSGQARRDFSPDYGIFVNPDHPIFVQARAINKRLVVSKEELGNDRFTGTHDLNECNYEIFPDDESLQQSHPVFTFRDPYRTYDSWLAKGWNDIDSFILAYETILDTFERAKALRPETPYYTYEFMTDSEAHQIAVFTEICGQWGIEFNPDMFRFTGAFGEGFVFSSERERQIYTSNPKGIFDTVSVSQSVLSCVPGHGLIGQDDKRRIDGAGLSAAYRDIDAACRSFYNRKHPNIGIGDGSALRAELG